MGHDEACANCLVLLVLGHRPGRTQDVLLCGEQQLKSSWGAKADWPRGSVQDPGTRWRYCLTLPPCRPRRLLLDPCQLDLISFRRSTWAYGRFDMSSSSRKRKTRSDSVAEDSTEHAPGESSHRANNGAASRKTSTRARTLSGKQEAISGVIPVVLILTPRHIRN